MLSGESRTQAGAEQYDYTFAYDNRGNRTSFAESVSGEVTTYEYDLNNRLVNAEKAFISPNQYKETTSYYYDPNGNTVTSVMETSDGYNLPSTQYHVAEIISHFTDVLGGYEFTRYEYDAFGCLTYFKNGSQEAEYTYNPDDMRSGKTVDGRTNVYVWDGDEIAAEFDYSNDTVILQKYIYGLDRVLMEEPGSVNVYYQQNSHGDTVTLTGTVNGYVFGTYEYDAFGNATDGGADYTFLESGHMLWSATRNNQFRYCGEYFDQETDSYYLRARYYDPALGRFITEDSIREDENWYIYCNNNSINAIDPTGLRTYIINGINNSNESGPPQYSIDFSNELTEKGVEDVRVVGVYNGTGTISGVAEVIMEMANHGKYSEGVANMILEDLKNDPLTSGEELNLIGYSGGGQIVLNVCELLEGEVTVDNSILIAAPVCEMTLNNTGETTIIYAGFDPLSWNISWYPVNYEFAGWIGHTSYFNSSNIGKVADIVNKYID